jgi:hypothetical protein
MPRSLRVKIRQKKAHEERLLKRGVLRPSHRFFIGPRLPAKELRRIQCALATPAEKAAKAAKNRAYSKKNRAAVSAGQRAWREANKERLRAWRIAYAKTIPPDSNRALIKRLRCRVKNAITFNRGVKTQGTMQLVGCTIQFLRVHLESQFLPGMTWENHSRTGWHIDHIVPVSAFDLSDPIQQRICFNYRNMRPLWAADNIRKSDRTTIEAITMLDKWIAEEDKKLAMLTAS